MLKDEETDSEKITNFSSPWRQWGTEASLKPILVPKGQAPSWKLCCFAFWLFNVLLQAFHFYGRNNLPDTGSALTTSLPPGRRLASITQKNLWNSVLLHIQASACLTFVFSPELLYFHRTKFQLHSENETTVGPWKTSQILGPHFSTIQSHGFSGWVLPRPVPLIRVFRQTKAGENERDPFFFLLFQIR